MVKKKHNVKNTFVSNESTEILYLGYTFEGTVHDKNMIQQEELMFPDGAFVWKDLGYQGSMLGNILCFEPHKKPKNAELTKDQKAENELIAAIRIVVEHAISGVKRCRIVKETIRLYDYHLRDNVLAVCTALHNFRVKHRKPYRVNPVLQFCPL